MELTICLWGNKGTMQARRLHEPRLHEVHQMQCFSLPEQRQKLFLFIPQKVTETEQCCATVSNFVSYMIQDFRVQEMPGVSYVT